MEKIFELLKKYNWKQYVTVGILALICALCSWFLSSCSVGTRLTGTKLTVDTTHYIIHTYTKNYDKNR